MDALSTDFAKVPAKTLLESFQENGLEYTLVASDGNSVAWCGREFYTLTFTLFGCTKSIILNANLKTVAEIR